MAKFFELCEEHDPANNQNPAYELYEFLREKGIDASFIKGELIIATEKRKIPVKVKMDEEEDAESINPEYNINREVEDLADTANSRLTLKGAAAALYGTPAQKAKSARDRRVKQVIPKAIDLYDKKTKALERDIGKATQKKVGSTSIV